MNRSMLQWVTGRGDDDQPLTKAAREALEADPTPRPMHMGVDHEGQPIERNREEPLSQIELPLGAT